MAGDGFAKRETYNPSALAGVSGRFHRPETRPADDLQDDWKISQRLTTDDGLRWDAWMPPIDHTATLVGFTFANRIVGGVGISLFAKVLNESPIANPRFPP